MKRDEQKDDRRGKLGSTTGDKQDEIGDKQIADLIASLSETHTLLKDHFRLNPSKSILPSRPQTDNLAERALQNLDARRKAARGQESSTLDIGEPIGQGGMGLVHEAKQISMGRTVAVKTLHPQLPSASIEMARMMLMQEAWMTGSLEHPNVMPVYDIELSEEGRPLVTFKRIEGVNWDQLICDAKRVRECFGEKDHLKWNLGILQQVCNAVHFAHSRHIIHRDLKPENVMVGSFGEVYVLDWGLALALDDDGTGRLPLAIEAHGIAGTPAYMAPEVLVQTGARLSEKTDIYQLGAILHEIISGRPPHLGASQEEIIESVLRSKPNLPENTPIELSNICRRAMHPESELRYDTADQFRIAISGFIEHSGSISLETKALSRLNQLLREMAEIPEDERKHRRHLYNLFGECRFAYRQALEIWPENRKAREGVRRATEIMVGYELDRNELGFAASLIAELDHPPEALQRRMQESLAVEEKEQRRIRKLERMDKQLDMRTGQRQRAFFGAVLGALWAVMPLLGSWALTKFASVNHFSGSLMLAGILIVLGAIALVRRKDLMQTAISRRLLGAGAIAIACTIVLSITAQIMGLGYVETAILWQFGWFTTATVLVVTVDWRILPMSLGYLAALLAAATWPEVRYYTMSLSNLIAAITMFFVWRPKNWKEPIARANMI